VVKERRAVAAVKKLEKQVADSRLAAAQEEEKKSKGSKKGGKGGKK